MTHFFIWQTNREYREGIKKPSEAAILKFSANLNVMRANHENLVNQAGGPANSNVSIPNLREDVSMLLELFRDKFGRTKTALATATKLSKLAGGTLEADEIGWKRMMAARPELRSYIQRVVESGDVYYERGAPPEAADDIDDLDGDVGGGDDGGGGDDDDPDDDGVLEEDDPTEVAKKRATTWLKRNRARPLRGETEEEYTSRIKAILVDGVTSRRRRNEAAADAEPTAAEEESAGVGVAARLFFEKEVGVKDRRPAKLLLHEDKGALGNHYLVLWRDPGYGGQDVQEWHPTDYVLKFPGLLQDYQAVPSLCAYPGPLCSCMLLFYSILPLLDPDIDPNPNPNPKA